MNDSGRTHRSSTLQWADNYLEVYWQSMAVAIRPRVWWSKGARLWPPVYVGSDEWHRVTLVIGRLVIALWSCRCRDCREYRAELDAMLDAT